MVGTAVYQVGRASESHWKKRSALKPGVQNTLPPAASDDSTAAISPWMWNSGMMFRQRSLAVRPSVAPIWEAEAARLASLSGTSFGRDVVPEVWSSNAMSSALAKPGTAGWPTLLPSIRKLPAGGSGDECRPYPPVPGLAADPTARPG